MSTPVPRRSFRRKVATTFAALALVPLFAITAIATVSAVRYLQRSTRATLEYDLEIARLSAARELVQVAQHLDFLSRAVLRDHVVGRPVQPQVDSLANAFIRSDSTAILRIKAVDEVGDLVFWASVLDERPGPPGSNGELFYLTESEAVGGLEPHYLPVELRGPDGGDEPGLIPAVAILAPLVDEEGRRVGVAVAEAALSALFDGLDFASPGLQGVTGLTDGDGRFLYHSERKNDWATLLASQGGINLLSDFDSTTASAILSGTTGSVRLPGGGMVSYRPLADEGLAAPLMTLYRAVDSSAIDASVRQFLLLVALTVLGTLGLVVLLGSQAASRVTGPLLALRAAARSLARGDARPSVQVRTGDEMEDLAEDFESMAHAIETQRRQLADLVAERTKDLETTRSELSQVVTHAADAIIGLDAGGRVRFWNRGAEALFGYTEDEAADRDIDTLLGRDASRVEAEFLRRGLREGVTITNHVTHRSGKEGEPFPVSLTQAPVTDEEGRVVGASLVVRDFRAQSRIEEQMRYSERLATASIMAAGLAHEINNPLAILHNRIELMQREARENPRLTEDLEVLESHVLRLRGMTSDLLAFAREESSGDARVRIDEVTRRLGNLLERTFVTQGVRLSSKVAAVPPVQGDEKAIEAVLSNLLTNAAQATGDGGRVEIELYFDEARDHVVAAVEDDGPGVPEELVERIFDPFFTTKDGTGLGLTLCRTIVERHGGQLRVERAALGGARFQMELPTYQGT